MHLSDPHQCLSLFLLTSASLSSSSLPDLPSLSTLSFGERSFDKLPKVVVTKLPALKSLSFGPNSFTYTTEVQLNDNPRLNSVFADKYALYNVKEFDMLSGRLMIM